MNKLLGFYELKDSGLPTIPWKIYNENVKLDPNILWTIRIAVHRGEDLNLPRCVGASAEESSKFALEMKKKYGENGMVIYYPYFMADKSGTLNVFSNKIIIEAVKDDLWNLVTNSKCDVTYIISEEKRESIGNEKFLNEQEIEKITSYIRKIRGKFRDDLLEGKSVLLEWSFAYNCSVKKQRTGDRYLVFYEVRTI